MDTLKELLALFGFGPENIQAVLYISLGSVFGTQVLKRVLPQLRGELMSVFLGGVCGSAFMPDKFKGALVGFILGAFWAIAYKPAMRWAYAKWPELEDKVSAKPRLKRMADGDIGIKDDEDDKTRRLTPEERELFIGAATEVPEPPTEPKP